MKVFVEKLLFQNRSPFDCIDIDLSENEIAVLAAANGRGKTTIISHIADAFHELAKSHFPRSFEGKENKFYRVTSGLNNLDGSRPSIFYMRLNMNGEIIDYVDILGSISEAEYQDLMIENKIDFGALSHRLIENNGVKHWRIDKAKAKLIFESNLITYFPSYRYETPGYIN